MSFGFLNVLMLAGLAALALPVIVHLISKRRYDVVEWGAMQFLELGRRTRRRVRLQDLWLMLLRMALLALLVFGLARPWAKGGIFSRFAPAEGRDVVLVLDGSYSMGRQTGGVTPRAAAIARAHELLDQLRPGDSVMLVDAREQPNEIVGSLTSDLAHVRRQLDALPPPSGTSRLAAAAAHAAQALASGTHLTRHVILLTDSQAVPWLPEDDPDWIRYLETRRHLPVAPQVFVVDVSQTNRNGSDANVWVAPLVLSRDLTVPNFPVRIRTTIHQSRGETSQRQVYFEVNGQRLDEHTRSVTLPADGQVPVEFEHRFPGIGSYVVSVAVEPDELPGDDRSEAAIVVEQAIGALLIDGDPQSDPVRSETFFLKAAFSPTGSRAPWVAAEVVDWRRWDATHLAGRAAVFLCNVPRLDATQCEALAEFVSAGGGLVIAPGDKVQPDGYVHLAELGLLPMSFDGQRREEEFTLLPIQFDVQSLEAGWLARFRTETGVDLAQTRFGTWWRLRDEAGTSATPAEASDSTADGVSPVDSDAAGRNQEGARNRHATEATQVDARLATLDPVICSRQHGRGRVVQLAIPLDADWSTMPTKNDYVPFVHELVFSLFASSTGRNVEVGEALQLPLAEGEQAGHWTFVDPGGVEFPGQEVIGRPGRMVELPAARLAGVYEARRASEPNRPEYFVASSDRRESDLTPLTAAQRQSISHDYDVQFVSDVAGYRDTTREEPEPTELWRWLLLGVLAGLILETLATRRLVRQGHVEA